MFERFTEKAIKVIMLAQEESRRLGHNFVGTEQLLLGLMGEGTGIAANVLNSFSINLKDARIEVEKIIGRGAGFVNVEIPFTPRAKRVLELALAESRELGTNSISTEHLLLGIISEGGGVAVRVIENFGVNLDKLRNSIIKNIGSGTSASSIAKFNRDRSSLPESYLTEKSELQKCINELQIAIEADKELSSETKELVLKMGEIILGNFQYFQDYNQQKIAADALKILQSSLDRDRNYLQSIENIQQILSQTALRIQNSKRSSKQSITVQNRPRFERFTEKAIEVIMLAQEESRRLGHNFVGTEQILLGLIGEGTGIAAKVLKSFDLNLENTRIEVEKIIGSGKDFVNVELPFTRRGKIVLELALDEVRQLKENYVYPEHLLLGIIRSGDNVAIEVMKNLGVNLEELNERIIQELAKTEREKIEVKNDEFTESLVKLSNRLDRVFSVLKDLNLEVLEISDLVKNEIEKNSILNSDFTGSLDRLPKNSLIKGYLKALKTAILADKNLTFEDKEEALEIVNFLAQASLKASDLEVQKYAKTALKILRGTIAQLPEDSQLVKDCQQILPKISRIFNL